MYTPHVWTNGELITAEKLNDLERGAGQAAQPGPKGEKGDPGTAGLGVKVISLLTDEAGKITGGTVTFSDDTTSPITVITE